ncbi:hypothetical protein TCELL_1223 [Thermogladius calderae 1633]|uniref:DUF2341 domain-containing protein n=1 Tax=Thermogladius calderae (strain DSM 22663 / VKM B-2946 / 1633) TaxID=1184251 RepID=I3TFV8_THEC1|nr:DUF2341 domain-containing protein [Thermogladius calderae]AFK51646.1 hypothetical protein TCELL_1223 [Thermogladius calderae 1633]
MPAPVLTHLIGFAALIAVFVALSLYAFTTVDVMNRRNMENVLSAVSSILAGSLRNLLISGANGSLLTLNLPVEVYYGAGYNVYIGNGSVLAQYFPTIRQRADYDPTALYVVAAAPDNKVWSVSLVLKPADLQGRQVMVATGSWVYNATRVGFDPNTGYAESGVPWLCREALYVKENSGLNLTNYLVRVVFNPSSLRCTYGLLNFTPSYNDLRFADSDGVTPLRYWIEYWNSTNAVVWVQVPYLAAKTNKTIFMYWGAPLATSRSDPGVFPVFYNFSGVDQQSIQSAWGILPVNATSWSITQYNLSGLSGVAVNATFPGKTSPTLLTLFYKTPLTLTPSGQGVIVEGYGAPLTLNDQDWRLALYNITGGLQWFGVQFIPPVIDPFVNLSNYTVIYGNWSIVSSESDTLLNAYNYSKVTISNSDYWAAAIVRWNPPSNAPRGQEEYQVLFKVLVKPDDVLRGLVLAQDTSLFKNFFVAVNSSGEDLELWIGDLNNAKTWTKVDSASPKGFDEPCWVFIYVDILGPGVSNHLTVRVYDAETGRTLLFYSKQSGLIPSDPNYVGAVAVSPYSIYTPENSLYDDLVAARYNTAQQTVDLTTITFVGLPAGWSVTLFSDNLTYSAVANESGVAVVDVSLNPILGVTTPVYIVVYDDQGNIVTTFVLNQTISGGTVFRFLPQLTQPVQQYGVAVHASGQPAQGDTPQYTVVFKNSSLDAWLNTNIPVSIGSLALAGVAYFNSTAYYVLYNTTAYYINSSYSYLYLYSVYYGYVDTGLVVIGTANGYSNLKTVPTSGFYYYVRARPFVYPEPSVYFGPVESASPPSMPVISYSLRPVVVFGSKLLVDVALVVTPSGDEVVVVMVKGARSS